MFRRTYTATLHSHRSVPAESPASGHTKRLYFRFEIGAVVSLSSTTFLEYTIEDGLFAFDPVECSAGFHNPFALDTDKYPGRRTVKLEMYVPGADGPREDPMSVYLESHASGLRGFHNTFAYRPAEAVYQYGGLPSAEQDSLIEDQLSVPAIPDDAYVFENVATGAVGTVMQDTVTVAADHGELTTVVPVSWPG